MTNVLSGTSVDLLIKENTNRFGNLKFFLGAKCLFNPKMIGLHFTTLVLLSSTALTIYLILSNFEESPKFYLTISIFSISSIYILFQLYFVSFSNPGFYRPREAEMETEYLRKTPMVKLKEANLFLKYCKTCKIIRDIRVFHCKICNLCVKRHDHHCPWLSVCIGAHNHIRFLILISFSIFHCLIIIAIMTIIMINYDKAHSHLKDDNENKHIIQGHQYDKYIAIGFTCLTTLALLLLMLIIFFQIKFICNNETTSESIRRPDGLVNIYDNGCKKNCNEFFSNISAYKNDAVYNSPAVNILNYSLLVTEYFDKIKTRGSITEISRQNSSKTDASSSNIEMNISNYSGTYFKKIMQENTEI